MCSFISHLGQCYHLERTIISSLLTKMFLSADKLVICRQSIKSSLTGSATRMHGDAFSISHFKSECFLYSNYIFMTNKLFVVAVLRYSGLSFSSYLLRRGMLKDYVHNSWLSARIFTTVFVSFRNKATNKMTSVPHVECIMNQFWIINSVISFSWMCGSFQRVHLHSFFCLSRGEPSQLWT